jgi:hypothetical protein
MSTGAKSICRVGFRTMVAARRSRLAAAAMFRDDYRSTPSFQSVGTAASNRIQSILGNLARYRIVQLL